MPTKTTITKAERRECIFECLERRKHDSQARVTINSIIDQLHAHYPNSDMPTAKTIRRDLKSMQDELAAEHDRPVIIWSAKDKSYNLVADVLAQDIFFDTSTSVALNQLTVTHLFLAQQSIAQYQHTPMYETLQNLYSQVLRNLPRDQQRILGRMHELIQFTGPDRSLSQHQIPPEIWNMVLQAARYQYKIDIRYRNSAGEISDRTIHPLGLVVLDRTWQLIAWDEKRSDLRTFRLCRIQVATTEQTPFQKPTDFTLAGYMQDNFSGHQTQGDNHTVVLHLTPQGAQAAYDYVWHPEEERISHEDGSQTVTFRSNALFKLEQDILAWGGMVQAIKPEALRQSVIRLANQIAQAHQR